MHPNPPTRQSSAAILRSLRSCLLATLSAAALLPASAHDHYAAGIVDTNGNHLPDAGEPLQLMAYDTASNGTAKTFHLCPRPVGFRPIQRCGGYYMLDERPRTLFPADGFSFIALSDGQYDIASPNHAHTGAYLWMEIVSVSGPPGARFGFWEENWSASHDTPTVSFATNQATGNYRFILSEGIDDPSEDPEGHIHGRSWTADKPGDYFIGFRLVDQSTSGPGGGPWHPPSQVYTYRFTAGPSFQPTGQRIPGAGYVLTWPSQMGIWNGDTPTQTGIVFTVQRSTTLLANDWQPIGTVTGTTAANATFTDPAPPAGKAFYRLTYSWSTP